MIEIWDIWSHIDVITKSNEVKNDVGETTGTSSDQRRNANDELPELRKEHHG
ncbi:hypothetical protein [Gordoniibacillus kamchatkensis]|uniref:hypothetical protein n=1 Tax=Gordoniibacillus kamchatkensis TaxID=1590651 RepID=UPI000AC7DADC|nr:hypothetical protein [Paenibacillus sp. VKM B-2647]